MGDPVGVSKAILNTLNDDGTFMLVEPFANDELKDNLNSQSGLYYSFSIYPLLTFISPTNNNIIP